MNDNTSIQVSMIKDKLHMANWVLYINKSNIAKERITLPKQIPNFCLIIIVISLLSANFVSKGMVYFSYNLNISSNWENRHVSIYDSIQYIGALKVSQTPSNLVVMLHTRVTQVTWSTVKTQESTTLAYAACLPTYLPTLSTPNSQVQAICIWWLKTVGLKLQWFLH